MGPKSSGTSKEKLIDEDEEVLQAVILADSFNKRFRPLTTRKPRVRRILVCTLPSARLIDMNSASFRSAMLHCWTGRSKALRSLVYKRYSSFADLTQSW